LGKFEQNLGEVKILNPPKNLTSYGNAKVSFIPGQYNWDFKHEQLNMSIE